MALKGQREELQTNIKFFLNEVAERGVICSYSTFGSGAGMDQSAALVTVAANSSGKKPAGLLLNDMVDIDQTRQHINWHQDEVVKGSKVTLLRKGWVVTNQVVGSPTAGDSAYLTSSGQLTPTLHVTGGTAATPKVGEFSTIKDENGYCTVEVNLPL